MKNMLHSWVYFNWVKHKGKTAFYGKSVYLISWSKDILSHNQYKK